MVNHLIQIADNSKKKINKDELNDLLSFAGKPIKEIKLDDCPNLLIFPQSLSDCKDKIQDSPIFSMQGVDTLVSANIMGFVGKGDTRLRIYSRFAKEDGQDWFLHYMLQKVFHINLFDLQYGTDHDEIFDFLMYLFPDYLTQALQKGLYKEYQTFNHNDAHIRGRIDIARHIRQNIPFTGKVAYQTREYTCNNALTQLIRHTIEYIRAQSLYASILRNDSDTKEAVSAIEQATPNYNRQERQRIIHQNLRPIRHPYYSEYRQLQQLCLQILRHKELKYSNTNDQIYGILFDGAWLWEEYLATILTDFTHPRNKTGEHRRYLFTDHSGYRYPDFYKDNFVLDAKYKDLACKEISQIDRNDLHQIIAYMHVEKAQKGGFIFPSKLPFSALTSGTLRGYGGTISLYGLNIPREKTNMHDFATAIRQFEKQLLEEINYQKRIHLHI